MAKKRGKTRKIKKKIQPVQGKKRGRTVKVKKDVFVEEGTEFEDQEGLVDEAKRISKRKFRVAKPVSLSTPEQPSQIAESSETRVAPLEPRKKRKIKRKKK